MKIIECPRDAIQGIKHFISTDKKIEYINLLVKSGIFDTIDFGSFVSHKAIPQMADTAQVIDGIELENTTTQLLAIIANEKGAVEASTFEKIKYLGYPFSISETFQKRNTNATISESIDSVKAIQEICIKNNKTLVIYISMAFGNPYNDVWNVDMALHWISEISKLGVHVFSLADTIGIADTTKIKYLFENIIREKPNLEIGAHFHSDISTWKEKIETAYNAGCRRFDGAILGYGGCPMAQSDLIGNIPTEKMVPYLLGTDNANVLNQLAGIEKAFGDLIKV